jgi:hypothetical protein
MNLLKEKDCRRWAGIVFKTAAYAQGIKTPAYNGE